MWRKNILIEDITKEELKKLDTKDLQQLRSRFINLFDKHFIRYDSKRIGKMSRMKFMAQYNLLRKEMDGRGIKSSQYLPIDQELGSMILKSVMWGLDITMLNDMLMIPDYISISGKYIESPKSVKEIDVVVKSREESRSEKFEAVIGQLIKEQTRKEPKFTYKPEGSDSSYIPIYDLILKAHEKIEKIKLTKDEGSEFDINKPYPNEHSCRLREPGEFKDKPWGRTERISDGKRYSIITGRLKGETTGTEQAYRYAKDIWTEAQARAHCKDHDGILFEPAKEVEKKLSEAQQKNYDEETEKIRENREKAKYPHKFKAAKWTHPNGHPRCIICGDEETIDGMCEKSVAKFEIRKVDKKQQIVGGIVYEPHEVDTQGDYTDEKEIEKAMYKFMEKYATDTKRARINHEGKRYFFPILECFHPDEDTMKGGKVIKKGSWWLMMKVTNKNIWEKIESGELEAFSMGGVARA